MLAVAIQKILNKKWLFFCLLLGSVLLVGTAASFPMYRNAVFNRMLQDQLTDTLREDGTWPMIIPYEWTYKTETDLEKLASMEENARGIYERLGVEEYRSAYYYAFANSAAVPDLERAGVESFSLRTGFLSGLEDHITLVDGELFSESGVSEDGCLEALISEQTMLQVGAVIGDVYTFPYYESPKTGTLRVRIVGVFRRTNDADLFWQAKMRVFTSTLFVNEKIFRERFLEGDYPPYTISCQIYDFVDYEKLRASHVEELTKLTGELCGRNRFAGEPDYLELLDAYTAKKNRIQITLLLLQVPLLLLLCAFLLMLSGQLFELERNEISVYRSRGASGFQIFRLFLLQSSLLSAVGVLLGLPLGRAFCGILGSASNFLEFGVRRQLDTRLTPEVWLFALGAAVVCILIMTLPVIRYSKVSIVNLKATRNLKKSSWWEKAFLDLIFIAVSLYGYYSYSSNTQRLTESALKGEGLDPLLYFSSTLFILGVGMLSLRLQPLLAKLLFTLRRGHIGPAGYASFLEVIRNGRKQQYIMLFMILTVALGMFDAVSARTILQNTLKNTDYLDGTDLAIREVWTDNSTLVAIDPSVEFAYNEPNYAKYAALANEVTGYTKVQLDYGYVSLDARARQVVTMMGIHTKEFGQITMVEDALLEEPYYELLNRLAMNPNGVLLSSNFRDILSYQEGGVFYFNNEKGKRATAFILGFFDYWPTYAPTTKSVDANGEVITTQNYYVISNFAMMQKYFGLQPYQIWMGLPEGADTDFFYDWADSTGLKLTMYRDRQADLRGVVEDPLLQGMNGVLTMSFIVMLILCAVGYLIYWILSIRSRELLLGILRAIGMHKSELLHILFNEQIFSGFYAIAVGIGTGVLAYRLYVPMLQMAYSTTEQVLPLQMITQTSDMVRLFVIVGLTMAVCLAVLAGLIYKLNITRALKLGEE
ncbi:MAG: ABC transporter permease [Lachnospiraceae bacterium]|nr:ABC transporter permease [Lachnospiraceae bacterium]